MVVTAGSPFGATTLGGDQFNNLACFDLSPGQEDRGREQMEEETPLLLAKPSVRLRGPAVTRFIVRM